MAAKQRHRAAASDAEPGTVRSAPAWALDRVRSTRRARRDDTAEGSNIWLMTNPRPDVVAKLNAIADKKRDEAMHNVELLKTQAAELTRLRGELRQAESSYRKGYTGLIRGGFFTNSDLRAAGLPAPDQPRREKVSEGDGKMRA